MPWEIGRLTDWQIEKLIMEPSVRRAKEFEMASGRGSDGPADFEGASATAAADGDRDAVPTEEAFVEQWTRQFGMGKEHWRQVYRDQFGKG